MAQRIQQKRSSVAGKRPSASYLEPGELALNTNSGDPGIFFELNDGSIAKAGPVSISSEPPTTDVGYGQGEVWLDSGNGTLNVWSAADNKWIAAVAPQSGGAETVVYVGTAFPEADDSLANDGSAKPFATLNRACMEIARRSILQNRLDQPLNAKFSIVLLPGDNVVYNEPGVNVTDFEDQIAAFVNDQSISPETLRAFNPVSGGLLLPRGTSIVGQDLRKTRVTPTHYPYWTRGLADNNLNEIEDRTNIIKWTGNSFVGNLTFGDKISSVSVKDISGNPTDVATLTSLQPHGYRALVVQNGDIVDGDQVTLSYPNNVSQLFDGESILGEGTYYVQPLDNYRFQLRTTAGAVILRNQLPEFPGSNTVPPEYLRLTFTNTTHHRLSSLGFATQEELNDYYVKVQRAFATLDFAGAVNNAEVNGGEYVIVSPTPSPATVSVDNTNDGSPYALNLGHRSDFGLSGPTADGAIVSGFKSFLAANISSVSLQTDAEVFEVYYDGEWISLKLAYSKAYSVPLSDVTNTQALEYMANEVQTEDIRYYYRAAFDIPGDDQTSSGLPSEKSDTRHYGTLITNGGYAQISNAFTIGCAVDHWARNGGRVDLTNSSAAFGAQSLRSEGFAGIGTAGGAIAPDQGFSVQGIRRPVSITAAQLKDTDNHEHFYINSSVRSTSVIGIFLEEPFDAKALLPYTLRAGSKIWCSNITDGTEYSATLADPPVSSDGLTINVLSDGNTITGVAYDLLSVPYVRRFIDPRKPQDATYQLWVSNASGSHRPPSKGAVLRLAEKPSPSAASLLVPGKQLDPGQNGGWNHLFQVALTLSKETGDNPNSPVISPEQADKSADYYLAFKLGDASSPWVTSNLYQEGNYSSQSQLGYYAYDSQTTGGTSPAESSSGWTRALSSVVCQPWEEAYTNGIDNADDPNDGSYAATDCYLRGVPPIGSFSTFRPVIDYDFGGDDLGLVSGNFANPTYINPSYEYTYASVKRFLILLGYVDTTVDTLMLPQVWSSRNLAISSFPNLDAEGYARSVGNWPVEFNIPSLMNSIDVTWDAVGYFNYSKGLPQYRDSVLTRTQLLDAATAGVWGGHVSVVGSIDNQLNLLEGSVPVGPGGKTLG